MSASAPAQEPLTNAQKLAAAHAADAASHKPTVEDVPDEDDKLAETAATPAPAATAEAAATPASAPAVPMSAKAAGKRPAPDATATKKSSKIDTSEEAFPSLGAPKTQATGGVAWGQPPPTAAPVIANGSTMRSGPNATGQALNLPGQYQESMPMPFNSIKPAGELRKPLPEMVRDINKRSKANVEFQSQAGRIIFTGKGPTQESVQQALKEVAASLGSETTIKVPVPASVRPFIIGKGGATIQAIMQRSGARIQLPRPAPDQVFEEDDTVDVEVRGNPLSCSVARQEIEKIVNERTSTINTRLRTVPPELFPFIAGPNNDKITSFETGRDVRVKVPQYHTWRDQAPVAVAGGQGLGFRPQDGHHIQISGEREAVRQIQAQIEAEVERLQQQLRLEQVAIERERHQFIIGKKGQELQQFLAETGCSVILPPDHQPDAEEIYIVGPPDKIEEATNRVMDLASSMSMASVDVARQHPGSARSHAADVSRYLQQRKALEQFENQYNAQIVAPTAIDGPSAWTIYARDGRNSTKARSDLLNLIQGHPPSRFRNVNVHPYYRQELQHQHAALVRDQYGVHLVFPRENDDSPLVLVYEGQQSSSEYAFPRSKPTPSDVAEFQRALQEAEQYIAALAVEEGGLSQRTIETPAKYHDKLQRYIHRENQREPRPSRPVQFLNLDRPSRSAAKVPVEFRGPSQAVDDFAKLIADFIEEQIRDEAERDYTTSLPFPQKHASVLIGRRGENINKLREEFDVEIQIEDGNVEVKGPKAKADACKAHIASLSRKLEDERTHVLKIKPQFHGELIGSSGKQVSRLQEKTGCRITFPRGNTSPSDGQSVADGASEAGGRQRPGARQAPDEVIIRGPSRGADEAREEILALYQYAQDNSHSAVLSVEQSALGSLIGQGGREMDKIRTETETRIDVPGSKEVPDASGRVEIRIQGSKSGVEKARKILEARSKTIADNVSKTLTVDKRHHRALIGQNGENLRQLILAAGGSDESRRIIQFPRADAQDNAIRLDGNKNVVDKLIEAIEEFVSERESQVTDSIEVAPERHGGLIGKGGETRKGLESQFGVRISIPSTSVTGPERSQIRVSGKPESVQQVKDKIAEMVKEPTGTVLQVPHRLHHAVASGNLFREFRDRYGVSVDHGGRRTPARPAAPQMNGGNLPLITDDVPDASRLDAEEHHKWHIVAAVPAAGEGEERTIPWVFKGSDEDKIAQAIKAVEARIDEAQKERLGFLVLPDPKSYRHVIGPSGSTINGIRKETGCKIDVPKQGSSGAVEIQGNEDQIERAKELIIEAVMSSQRR